MPSVGEIHPRSTRRTTFLFAGSYLVLVDDPCSPAPLAQEQSITGTAAFDGRVLSGSASLRSATPTADATSRPLVFKGGAPPVLSRAATLETASSAASPCADAV